MLLTHLLILERKCLSFLNKLKSLRFIYFVLTPFCLQIGVFFYQTCDLPDSKIGTRQPENLTFLEIHSIKKKTTTFLW